LTRIEGNPSGHVLLQIIVEVFVPGSGVVVVILLVELLLLPSVVVVFVVVVFVGLVTVEFDELESVSMV